MIPLSEAAIGKTLSGLLRSGDVREAAEALLGLPPPPAEMYEDQDVEGEHPHDPEAAHLLHRLMRKSRMMDVVRHVGPLAAAPALAMVGYPHAALMMAGGAISQIPWTVERVLLQRKIERLRGDRNLSSPEEVSAFKAGVKAAESDVNSKRARRARMEAVEEAAMQSQIQAQMRRQQMRTQQQARQQQTRAQQLARQQQAKMRQQQRLSRNLGTGSVSAMRKVERRIGSRAVPKRFQAQAANFGGSRATSDAFRAGIMASRGMRF